MTQTIQYTGSLAVVTCWCGMKHAVPSGLREYQQRCHDDGEKVPDIYCPLGHCHVPSGEGRADLLRRQLNHAQDRAARSAAERDQARASERAQKAAATRARNERNAARKRSAAAVCPCCHRSFKQLRRHMASQHPDYDPEAD